MTRPSVQVLDLFPASRLLQPGDVVLDPSGGRLVRGVLARRAAHVIAQDIGERRAGAGQLRGQVIDVCIRLVADDKVLLAVEHRQPAAHMVERGLEAGVELLERFVALDERAELLLQSRLQMRNLFAREELRCLLATRGFWPPRSEGKLERTLGHVWPSLQSPQRSSNSKGTLVSTFLIRCRLMAKQFSDR